MTCLGLAKGDSHRITMFWIRLRLLQGEGPSYIPYSRRPPFSRRWHSHPYGRCLPDRRACPLD